MNGPMQQLPNQKQGPIKIKVPCAVCQKEMEVVMPMPRIFNAIDVSSITFVHNRPDICTSCNTMFLPIVEGLDENGCVMFRWQPVKGNRAPMIVGGGADELRKAIENANIAEKIKIQGN